MSYGYDTAYYAHQNEVAYRCAERRWLEDDAEEYDEDDEEYLDECDYDDYMEGDWIECSN